MANEEQSGERLLKPGEVARLLRIDVRTVLRWAKSGKLPSICTPGGHHLFRVVGIVADVYQMHLDGDKLLNVTEVAETFNVERQTVLQWLNRGLIQRVETSGKHHMFRKSEIEAYLQHSDESPVATDD